MCLYLLKINPLIIPYSRSMRDIRQKLLCFMALAIEIVSSATLFQSRKVCYDIPDAMSQRLQQ